MKPKGPNLEKIQKIKDALARKGELSLTEIARESEMPLSTVYVYLTQHMANQVELVKWFGKDRNSAVVTIYKLK
jgi:hypothetical protein